MLQGLCLLCRRGAHVSQHMLSAASSTYRAVQLHCLFCLPPGSSETRLGRQVFTEGTFALRSADGRRTVLVGLNFDGTALQDELLEQFKKQLIEAGVYDDSKGERPQMFPGQLSGAYLCMSGTNTQHIQGKHATCLGQMPKCATLLN